MRSFIIHMSSSVARHENAQRLLETLPNAELVEAVNGRDPAHVPKVALFPGNLHRPHYPFALQPAEVGVFESNRKIWQSIVDQGLEYALIVEDDLQIDAAKWTSVMTLIADHATSDMYIRLPVKDREKPVQVVARAGDSALFLPRRIGLQCICQVVGRDAARRLLAATTRIDRPIDTFLQMHWASGQPVHAIWPTGNREIAGQIGGSTIQRKTRASGKLTRELKRAWYRAQIALHLQKA
jgi:glycosyl transferase, family 25